MGGAAFALADDSSALGTNPAALARLNRIELAGGLRTRSDDMSGEAFGAPFATKLSRTEFSSLRFAYPFPTFRGSLVFGLSGERVYSFDDDFFAVFEDTITWEENEGDLETGPWEQTEDNVTQGGINAWTVGAAFDASPSVSLGASVSYWTGDFSRRFSWLANDTNGISDNYDTYELSVNSTSDVSGVRARLGGLFYLAESAAVGVIVDSPVTLTFEGTEVVSEAYNGVYSDPADVTHFSDKLELPFSFGVGASFTPSDLIMLAADVQYTDWSQMTYEGFLYLDDPASRRNAYETTTEYRMGVEVTVPSWPLRLRGGYMSRPIAYRGLEVDADRSYFTVGAGVLIDTVLSLDVAWMTGAFERSGKDYDYDEQVDDSALLMEATYRF